MTKNWICSNKLTDISFYNNLQDIEAMRETDLHFSQGSSNGILGGCIGALDGWLVKIDSPSLSDGIENIGGFYRRKGFYALNVQVIVDKYKRVKWFSIFCRGGENDSTAFKGTGLYRELMNHSNRLSRLGFYIFGDSDYSLRNFLITPFDNVHHGTPEDNFNFFHSSCMIYVECAFG